MNYGEEEITFLMDEEHYNFDTFDACNVDANDHQLIYYDWLANMATMSHVMHQREAFTDYTPMGNSSVTGVGGKEAVIMGHGTVELKLTCNGTRYTVAHKTVPMFGHFKEIGSQHNIMTISSCKKIVDNSMSS